MLSLEETSLAVDWFENHPVVGTAILGCVAYTVRGIFHTFYKWKRSSSSYAKPVFWSLGKKYRITAVHQYFPSDDISGYTQVQNSRPDQWKKLITIESKLFNCRHKIVPNDKTAILALVISRNGIEREKVIFFNK